MLQYHNQTNINNIKGGTIMRRSIIWTVKTEKLQIILNESNSYSDVLRKFGYTNFEGNIRTLKDRIKVDNLDLKKLSENRRNAQQKLIKQIPKEKIPLNKLLVENSPYGRGDIKSRLIDEGILKYECLCCGNTGEWNNKKLTLQLEHKNGISNDNRLENLCLLCPNCHSQTDTYAGKRNSQYKKVNNCKICKATISNSNKTHLCMICASEKRKKLIITKEELESLLKQYTFVEIAKMHNVSDSAIIKRCKKLGIYISKYKK